MRYLSRKKTYLVFFVMILFWSLFFLVFSSKSAYEEVASISFGTASDFTISDQYKVTFSNQSVKLTPTGITQSWAKTWHDSHFSPSQGDSGVYGVAVDNEDYIYLSGLTASQTGALETGFIVKTNQDLEEVWYLNSYAPNDSTDGVIGRLAIDSNGDLIALAQFVLDGQGYFRLLKIRTLDGSVIWHQDLLKAPGVDWTSAWDGSAGPVLDASNNIYFVMEYGTDDTWENGEPMRIYKYSSQGSPIWQAEDSLAEHQPTYYGWEDIWDMEIDSEGSVYVAAGADENQSGHHINYGLVKYDTNGNRSWLKIKDFDLDAWQGPRGIAVDSGDNIYLNGNAASHGPCGIVKYDKDGNELSATQMGEGDFTAYCWGSKINQFDSWLISGPFDRGYGIKHRLAANSQYLFANSYDQKIYIFNKTDLSLTTTISQVKNAWSIFADENYLYVGTYEAARSGAILIYDLSDFSLVQNIETEIIPVKGVASDDNYLYAYAWRGIQTYSKADFSHQINLTPPAGESRSVYVDQDYLYAGNSNGSISLWNKDLSYNSALSGASASVNSVFADSSYIYGGSADSNIYVYDKNDFSLDATLSDPAGEIYSISSDDNYIFAASADDKVYIYNKSDFSLNDTIAYSYDANSVVSDSNYLYTAVYPYDNNIYVYNKSDFSLYQTIEETTNPGIFRFYIDTDLNLSSISGYADPKFTSVTHPPRNNIDKRGNFYNVISFKDKNHDSNNSILVVKDSNVYSNTNPISGTALTLETKTGVALQADISGFEVNYGPMDEADVGFQFSPDGSSWYFWDGGSWSEAGASDYSTEEEINSNISSYFSQFGAGDLYLKVFMISDGTSQVDLASVSFLKTTTDSVADSIISVLPATGRYNLYYLLVLITINICLTFIFIVIVNYAKSK